MNEPSLEVSSSGIRFSYHRFLSDIAAGVFTLLLLIYVGYVDVALPPMVAEFKKTLWEASLPPQVRVFVLVLAALAAVPIGLTLNGVGFIVLGWVQPLGVRWSFRFGWPGDTTRQLCRRELVTKFFALDESVVYRRAKLVEGLLDARAPETISDTRHVNGLKTLLRSVALLALAAIVLSLFAGQLIPALFLAFCFVVMLLFTGLIEYYQCMSILFRAMALTIEEDPSILDAEERRLVEERLPALWGRFSAAPVSQRK